MAVITPKPKPVKSAKKAKNPPIDKEAILRKRITARFTFVFCECGCTQHGHDLHHCFIGRKKGYPVLDDERNLVLVNSYEHISRKFDNQKWRKYFWGVQCKRYGEAKMLEWIEQVKAAGIHPSRIDWL